MEYCRGCLKVFLALQGNTAERNHCGQDEILYGSWLRVEKSGRPKKKSDAWVDRQCRLEPAPADNACITCM